MAETITSIRTYLFIVAKEFYTTDTSELESINILIDDAMKSHNEVDLGSSFKKAIAYFVADQLKVSGFVPASSSGSGGTVSTTQEITKKKAGNLEITYSSNSTKKTQVITSSLQSTDYGARYLDAISGVINRPIYI
jgi:hypothetical protein